MPTNNWPSIGTIVGDASTAEFTFILRSFKSRVGDIVAVPMEVPNEDYSGTHEITSWGRITSIERFNPFFPYEAAQELASESIPLIDTVLSKSRDQLQSKVLVLGFTSAKTGTYLDLYPLTYPIPPAADVRYPPAEAIKALLAGTMKEYSPLKIGTLIARGDVRVDVAAERIAARHLAIMAMTGGGKTVAARRVLREFIELGYPVLILDPHGDYLGLWEKRHLFPKTTVKLFYPHIVMTHENQRIVDTLISKMTEGLTPPQQELLNWLLSRVDPKEGQAVLDYIKTLVGVAENVRSKKEKTDKDKDDIKFGGATANVVRRSLRIIEDRLKRMEVSNTRLRAVLKKLKFDPLPDPEGRPEGIIRCSSWNLI